MSTPGAAGPSGTRLRSGNVMPRTRAGLLDGASRSVASVGVRRSTMVGIATAAGIAKATVYNHFRTKSEVLVALVAHEVDRIVEVTRAVAALDGLPAGLAAAVEALRVMPARVTVAAAEPGTLAPLLRPGEGPGWRDVRGEVAALLSGGGYRHGPAEVGLVLRWLLGHLLAPADGTTALAEAAALLDGVRMPTVVEGSAGTAAPLADGSLPAP